MKTLAKLALYIGIVAASVGIVSCGGFSTESGSGIGDTATYKTIDCKRIYIYQQYFMDEILYKKYIKYSTIGDDTMSVGYTFCIPCDTIQLVTNRKLNRTFMRISNSTGTFGYLIDSFNDSTRILVKYERK